MEPDCVYYDSDQICISIPRHLYETVNSFPYVDICDEQLNKLLLGRILFRAEHAMFQIQKAEEPELSWERFLALLSQSGDMKKALNLFGNNMIICLPSVFYRRVFCYRVCYCQPLVEQLPFFCRQQRLGFHLCKSKP